MEDYVYFRTFNLIIPLSLYESQLCSAEIVHIFSWNMTVMAANILLALAEYPNVE